MAKEGTAQNGIERDRKEQREYRVEQAGRRRLQWPDQPTIVIENCGLECCKRAEGRTKLR